MSSIDLTGDEKFILKHLDKTLKYIARNDDEPYLIDDLLQQEENK